MYPLFYSLSTARLLEKIKQLIQWGKKKYEREMKRSSNPLMSNRLPREQGFRVRWYLGMLVLLIVSRVMSFCFGWLRNSPTAKAVKPAERRRVALKRCPDKGSIKAEINMIMPNTTAIYTEMRRGWIWGCGSGVIISSPKAMAFYESSLILSVLCWKGQGHLTKHSR